MDQIQQSDESQENLLEQQNEVAQNQSRNYDRQNTEEVKPKIKKVIPICPIENKQVRQIKSYHNFLLYFVFEMFISLTKHYLLAKKIQQMNEDKMANFQGFFKIYVYILLVEIVIRAIAISFNMMMTLQFMFAVPQLVFYMISYYKISNFLAGNQKFQTVLLTILLLIVISLLAHYIVINKLDSTAEIIYIIWHIEYIQIFLYLITYNQNTGQGFTFIYKIFYQYLAYCSTFVLIGIYFIFFLATLININGTRLNNLKFLFQNNMAICIIFYLMANSYINRKIFIHFENLENLGIFRPKNIILPPEKFFKDFKLYQHYCILNLSLGLFHVLISMYLFRQIKQKFFITEEIFVEPINLVITRYNNYFKKGKRNSQLSQNNQQDDEDCCFICWDNLNEIYLKPCGHTGICKPCFLGQIKSKQKCPICRQEIKRAYVILYDKENNMYQANTRIMLAQ